MTLTLEALRLRLGDFVLEADLAFPKASRTALIGPSGAGKSTLLSAIAGFLEPAGGRVLFDGRDLTGQAPGERPVSILFQDQNLFPHLSIAHNLGLGLRPTLRLGDEEVERVHDALDRVGLAGLGDRKPAALSGGQQSRAALARALLQDNPVLLLDEPFAALGPALKDEMLDLVRAMTEARGTTVIMVTHDPDDARRIADSVAVVAAGRVSRPQGTASVLDDPPPELRTYLSK